MKIRISVKYVTRWGEKLVLRIGGNAEDMRYAYYGTWEADLDSSVLAESDEYHFELWSEGVCLRKEWKGHSHYVPKGGFTGLLSIRDRWIDIPDDAPFYSSAFSKVIFKRSESNGKDAGIPNRKDGNVTFSVAFPQIRPDESLAISGSGALFGDWKSVMVLNDHHFPIWNITLNVSEPFEYKFAIVDKKTGKAEIWEEGSNHFFGEVPAEGVHLVISDMLPRFNVRPWKGAGTAVPLFSLRSGESFGVGEFNDIKLLVDWAVATGQRVIQLLPVNDTTSTGTWEDSYPYKANSSFALHPQFIHLPDAGVRADKAYRTLQSELNALPQEDYERVNNEKTRLMRRAFAEKGQETMKGDDYVRFLKDNAFWLIPYAAYRVLGDMYRTPDFSKWGLYAKYDPHKIDDFCTLNRIEVDFYCYEQFCLDGQLKEAVSYAHANGVVLKGDLPIGVSRNSADAWIHPCLFHLDERAGAPPDAFSALGQDWDFPTYDWGNMAKEGFAWWKARLSKLNEYFDAFRIDHILGFFRIWEIPSTCIHPLLGHFNPALPFSSEELSAFGFDMHEGHYSSPLINDLVLDEIFGTALAVKVKVGYVRDGRLVPSVSNQRKVMAMFDGRDDEDVKLRDGLLKLLDDVLFVEDPYEKGYYHPRILAQDTLSFRLLNEYEKSSFNRLYDDFFYRRNNVLWKDSAMSKLPELLASTEMLACGEDLGMVPDCVGEVLHDLRILSLEIQRMPKISGNEFGDICSYPYLSVCTTGTHDTSGIRAWWEEDRKVSSDFFSKVLHCEGETPYFCEPWICRKIVSDHLQSPSMLTILPFQDWLSVDGDIRYGGNPADERVNDPSDPHHYWRYRMHISLEDLIDNKGFNASLKRMISLSGR